MDLRYKVVLAHLRQVMASFEIPEEYKSKEDKGKQTRAVEQLLKDAVTRLLPEYRGKVYAVGGYVRDSQLGKAPKDIDIVVDVPEDGLDAAKNFANKLAQKLGITSENNPTPLKEAYGIYGLALMNHGKGSPAFKVGDTDVSGYVLEFTPPRKEGPYTSKREPSSVDYATLAEDAKRRDLTVNALYQDLATGEIKDFVGGMDDLKNKTLRPPEHPEGVKKIYMEDPLRIFRLIRFKGKLDGFDIDPKAEREIKEFAHSPEGQSYIKQKVSKERIRDELHKILTHPDANVAAEGMQMMHDLNVLKFVAPEFDKMFDIYHDEVHHYGESIWQHTLDVLKGTPPTLKARLGALFHDIGKLVTKSERIDKEGRQRVHFIGHDEYGREMARKALRELKFPGDIIDDVGDMVHAHMSFRPHGKMKPEKALRNARLFVERFYDMTDDALSLLKADSKGDPVDEKRVEDLAAKVEELKKVDVEKGLLAPKKGGKGYRYQVPISGQDILESFEHIKAGPVLGEIIRRLRENVLLGKLDTVEEQERAEEAKKLVKQLAGSPKQVEMLEKAMEKEKQKLEEGQRWDEEKGRPPKAPPFTKVTK